MHGPIWVGPLPGLSGNALSRYCWCLSWCMLVEINTWFLISKRTIRAWQRVQEVR
jgi:hypothetical protein